MEQRARVLFTKFLLLRPIHLITLCLLPDPILWATGQRRELLSQKRQLATILPAVRAASAPQCDIPRFTNAADGGESGS